MSYDVDSSPENDFEASGFSIDELGSEVVEEDKDLDSIQPLLSKAGLRVIRPSCFRSTSTPMLLICTASICQKGINAATAIHHATSKSKGSHGLKLHRETVVQPLTQWLESNAQRILSQDNARSVPIPHRNSAPLWGLEVMDGLACRECTRCFPAKNSMDAHWSQDHRGLLRTVEPLKRWRAAKLQTYFLSSAKYFEINPNLAGLRDDDIYSLYLTQHAEKMDKECSDLRPSPRSEKDIPPLLKVLLWHEHLLPYLTSKKKVMRCDKLDGEGRGDGAKDYAEENKDALHKESSDDADDNKSDGGETAIVTDCWNGKSRSNREDQGSEGDTGDRVWTEDLFGSDYSDGDEDEGGDGLKDGQSKSLRGSDDSDYSEGDKDKGGGALTKNRQIKGTLPC
jgi:hypothetical protein